jgi:hypothetical protein
MMLAKRAIGVDETESKLALRLLQNGLMALAWTKTRLRGLNMF